MGSSDYSFGLISEIQAQNAGVFMSRGVGSHPRRIITSYELIYVKHGVLDIREGSVEYTIREGESLLLCPGILHEGIKPYPEDLQYYWIHFSTQKTGISYGCNEKIRIRKHANIARTVRMEQLFRWFINDQETGVLDPFVANLMIYQMLNELELSSEEKDVKISPLAIQTYRLIKTRFADSALSTQALSETLHCNSDYLGRIFHQSYGMTISSCIHKTRVHYAQTLLLKNTMNVNDIALASGFSDPGYFRTVFKRMVGVNPSEYRSAYEKLHINTE
ncbi:AraC family transcriptional regulator [uncultured Sphaerochaeta sp.]|jgi:AraC-like DNA-binding protein|uniref:helix-turn-helix domain-containing protein n=1 Tax=uncultured Sphaerochaeta sp. TaxID=886478 RepID=UPI002A0A8A16|nr:AraC family transcriptional regulator [uncultured Sphaerochaeta sp.]